MEARKNVHLVKKYLRHLFFISISRCVKGTGLLIPY